MSGPEQKEDGASTAEEQLTFYTRAGQILVQREKERFIKKVEEAIAASPDDVRLQELLREQQEELEVIKNAPVEVDITYFETAADRERAVAEVKEQLYELRKQEPTPTVQTMIAMAERLRITYEKMPLGRREE